VWYQGQELHRSKIANSENSREFFGLNRPSGGRFYFEESLETTTSLKSDHLVFSIHRIANACRQIIPTITSIQKIKKTGIWFGLSNFGGSPGFGIKLNPNIAIGKITANGIERTLDLQTKLHQILMERDSVISIILSPVDFQN